MKTLLGLAMCITVILVCLIWEYDPALQQDRANNSIQYAMRVQADSQAYIDRVHMDENRAKTIEPYIVGAEIIGICTAVALGIILVIILLDQYAFRREPIVSIRPDGTLQIPRAGLMRGDYDILTTQLAIMGQRARMLEAGKPNVPQTISYAQRTREEDTIIDIEPEDEKIQLPVAPVWADIVKDFRPTPDRMLLGYSIEGPIYAPISALLSTALIGRPGQGKSTALRMVYAQTIMIGGQVGLLDPHGSVIADIANPPSLLFYASTAEELDNAANELARELSVRMAQFRSGKRDFVPYLVLADEMPVISIDSDAAVNALKRVICEGRKVSMYALTASQGAMASQWGNTMIRDAMGSLFIFKCSVRQGRMMGLEREDLPMLLDLDVGRCVLRGPVQPVIVAIPKCEPGDLVKLFEFQVTQSSIPVDGQIIEGETLEFSENERESDRNKSEKPADVTESDEVFTDEEQQIFTLIESGAKKMEIIEQVFGVHSGPAYQRASRMVDTAREKYLRMRASKT